VKIHKQIGYIMCPNFTQQIIQMPFYCKVWQANPNTFCAQSSTCKSKYILCSKFNQQIMLCLICDTLKSKLLLEYNQTGADIKLCSYIVSMPCVSLTLASNVWRQFEIRCVISPKPWKACLLNVLELGDRSLALMNIDATESW